MTPNASWDRSHGQGGGVDNNTVALSTYLLTVLLFQDLFQTQCLVLSSTYQRATPLFPPLQQLFSLYLAFIECSCV